MKRISSMTAALTIIVTSNSFADSIQPITYISERPWVFSLSTGSLWVKAGETQTLNIAPSTKKTFSVHKTSNILSNGEFFAGLQLNLMPKLLGQFGIAIARSGNAHLQGNIWDDANSKFANYHYDYFIQLTRIAVKEIFIFDNGYWIKPWISGSLGVGLNRSHGYSCTPLISEAYPINNFYPHFQSSFSYTLGMGFQKALSSQWQIGIGYEFADWGKNELGRALGQTSGSGIILNHLYTQGIMVNLTYLK